MTKNETSSQLWIHYEKIAPAPLDDLLMKGELEWITNAALVYGNDAWEQWAEDLLLRFITWQLAILDYTELFEFTPTMMRCLKSLDIEALRDHTLYHTMQIITDKR